MNKPAQAMRAALTFGGESDICLPAPGRADSVSQRSGLFVPICAE